MKVQIKKIDSTKTELYIEADSEAVRKKFEEVSKRVNQKAQVPGFRPGHIPEDLLEKNYGQKINQQVLDELIPEVYQKVIESQNLEVIDYPEISDIKLDRTSLSFKARVDTLPEVIIKNYRGIKINYKNIEVLEQEVEGYVLELAKEKNIQNIDDNFARSLGYLNLRQLKDFIEKQLFIQKHNQQYQNMQQQVFDFLLKNTDFKAPLALVEKKLNQLLQQAEVELALRGMDKEEIQARQNELSEELKPEAERQVRLQIILNQIAKQENINESKNRFQRVLEFLFKEADWQLS